MFRLKRCCNEADLGRSHLFVLLNYWSFYFVYEQHGLLFFIIARKADSGRFGVAYAIHSKRTRSNEL